MAAAQPNAVVLPECAHQATVLTLALPVDTGFELVTRTQLPMAAEAETVAVIVLALAGIEDQRVMTSLHLPLQGQLGIALLPQAR
ncbi:hypothetical protein D3C81_1363640 [compost metagenome]